MNQDECPHMVFVPILSPDGERPVEQQCRACGLIIPIPEVYIPKEKVQ